ncbi:MliC family protein [Phenylobacterium sp.]|uniref:MliC family protein n=1 Tax=Phenylobacterium sp. TaxID=1871053 RepID=UPI00374D02DD
MKSFALISVTLALGLTAAAAVAAAPMQPPMNDFAQAFYKCDGGDAFMMSYDAEDAKTATLAGNHDNKHHELKRIPSDSGVQYAGDHVTFWTDGKTVRVDGALAFKNCKLKSS